MAKLKTPSKGAKKASKQETGIKSKKAPVLPTKKGFFGNPDFFLTKKRIARQTKP